MSVLHVVSNPEAVEACLSAASEDDAVLLVGDGVFAQRLAEGTGIQFGVLGDDAASRGIQPAAVMEVLSYGGFVEWVAKSSKTVTWR